ncbi:MAG: hydrolase, partial [Gemmatimonadetes bacterium]|nr:hydrolase [Gemmatimonadota bacterium]NIQ56461.1 hydrolase [Gemmatimonadota bacterium]NIU76650.1 hydrolase [Gammaproteobacteria bacterium]NIX22413.1 hydrolase [Actinomycetota bacterium]NIX46090.1 hydrolase [Gemmatimonadota bacterium]
MTADGYVVEVGIPFRSLRFPDRSGVQSWSFYVERFWPRQSNVRMQSFYENEGEACRLCQVNRLTGLEGISSGGAVQLTPTVSVARADTRPLGAGGWSSGELSPEAGLDVQWSLTSDVTLNATVNPDFSQVEADVAQLEANQR